MVTIEISELKVHRGLLCKCSQPIFEQIASKIEPNLDVNDEPGAKPDRPTGRPTSNTTQNRIEIQSIPSHDAAAPHPTSSLTTRFQTFALFLFLWVFVMAPTAIAGVAIAWNQNKLWLWE